MFQQQQKTNFMNFYAFMQMAWKMLRNKYRIKEAI